jgi:hypothetical protein
MNRRAPWDTEVAGGVACVVLALAVGTGAPALSVGLLLVGLVALGLGVRSIGR